MIESEKYAGKIRVNFLFTRYFAKNNFDRFVYFRKFFIAHINYGDCFNTIYKRNYMQKSLII